MENNIYTWEHIRAYSIVALHNLLNSSNDVNLKNLKLFIDPLQTLHTKEGVLEYAQNLLKYEDK